MPAADAEVGMAAALAPTTIADANFHHFVSRCIRSPIVDGHRGTSSSSRSRRHSCCPPPDSKP
jgi:hypothetical protein